MVNKNQKITDEEICKQLEDRITSAVKLLITIVDTAHIKNPQSLIGNMLLFPLIIETTSKSKHNENINTSQLLDTLVNKLETITHDAKITVWADEIINKETPEFLTGLLAGLWLKLTLMNISATTK